MDIQEVGLDPARALALDIDPVPIVAIGATDQDDVGAFAQSIQEQVIRTRAVAAAQQIRGHRGFKTFNGRNGRR